MAAKQTETQEIEPAGPATGYVPDVEVEVRPKNVPLGGTVDVWVDVRNFDRAYQYTVDEWDVDAGEMEDAPDVFPLEKDRVRGRWNTNTDDMTSGRHAVTVTVTAHKKGRRVGTASGATRLTVTQHVPQLSIKLEKECEDDVLTLKAGESLCVTAEATNMHRDFYYECYIETPKGRIKAMTLEGGGRWRAHIPTTGIDPGRHVFKAIVHAIPRRREEQVTVQTTAAKEER